MYQNIDNRVADGRDVISSVRHTKNSFKIDVENVLNGGAV